MDTEDVYQFHEGCQYQLSMRDLQMRNGVAADPVCPSCEAQAKNSSQGTKAKRA